MDVVKKAFKCAECRNRLVKPVTLVCGVSVCLEHVENLKNSTYLCKCCWENHSIDNKSTNVNKALEMLIEANIGSINLGSGYKRSFESGRELDRVINDMEALVKDSRYFINQTIGILRNQIGLIRLNYKLKIDSMADEIVEKLNSYEEECKNYLHSNDYNKSLVEIDKNLYPRKQNLIRLNSLLNKFSSNENEWDSIEQNSQEDCTKIANDILNLKVDLLGNKLGNYVSLIGQFLKINLTSEFDVHNLVLKFYPFIKDGLDLNRSQIIDNSQKDSLLKLCGFSSQTNWRLIYRGSEHGLSVQDFHSNCDTIANTLTIVKSMGGNIFGGYTQAAWDQSNTSKKDPNAFLFSLVNPQNQPIKFEIQNSYAPYAIYCNKDFGPSFGHGNDLNIKFFSNKLCINSSFQPQYFAINYIYYPNNFTESEDFDISDIEIYQLIS